jgi:hypothetical protein
VVAKRGVRRSLRVVLGVALVVAAAAAGLLLLPMGGEPLRVPGDFESLAEATRRARSGQVILLAEGVYDGEVVVRGKRLTIRAEPPGARVEVTADGPALTVEEGGRLRAEGIDFVARTTSLNGNQGARVWGSSAEFVDCRLVGSGRSGAGLDVRNGRTVRLEDCEVYGGQGGPGTGGGTGAALMTARRVELINTRIEGGRGGDAVHTFGQVRGGTRHTIPPAGRGGFGLFAVDVREGRLVRSTVKAGDGGSGLAAVLAGETQENREDAGGGYGSISVVLRGETKFHAEETTLLTGRGGPSGGFGSMEGRAGRPMYLDTGATYNELTGDVSAWVLR